MHQRSIWALVAELLIIKNGCPSKLGSQIFVGETESYDLKIYFHFHVASKILDILPTEIKQQTSLSSFEKSVNI